VTGFVVMVEFLLKPGTRADFRKLMDANARDSAKLEPGCRRFDVLEPQGEGDRILLYEIYDDRAAFDVHARSAHYLLFDRASSDLVARKTITICDLVCEGSA
jgi:quinol monooxygenase YgiN